MSVRIQEKLRIDILDYQQDEGNARLKLSNQECEKLCIWRHE